jgi:hypothetical protein
LGASWPAEAGPRRKNEEREEEKGLHVCLSFREGGGELPFGGYLLAQQWFVFSMFSDIRAFLNHFPPWSPISKHHDRWQVVFPLCSYVLKSESGRQAACGLIIPRRVARAPAMLLHHFQILLLLITHTGQHRQLIGLYRMYLLAPLSVPSTTSHSIEIDRLKARKKSEEKENADLEGHALLNKSKGKILRKKEAADP